MAIVLTERPVLSVGSTRPMAIDCTGQLDTGELLLTAVPTITEVGYVSEWDDGQPVYTSSTDLSISNKSVNTSPLDMSHGEVAVRKSVQCVIAAVSAVAGRIYGVRITVSTTTGVLTCDVLIVVQ